MWYFSSSARSPVKYFSTLEELRRENSYLRSAVWYPLINFTDKYLIGGRRRAVLKDFFNSAEVECVRMN